MCVWGGGGGVIIQNSISVGGGGGGSAKTVISTSKSKNCIFHSSNLISRGGAKISSHC